MAELWDGDVVGQNIDLCVEIANLKKKVHRYQTARRAMDKFNADRNGFDGSIAERNQRNNELFEELLAARDGLMEVE